MIDEKLSVLAQCLHLLRFLWQLMLLQSTVLIALIDLMVRMVHIHLMNLVRIHQGIAIIPITPVTKAMKVMLLIVLPTLTITLIHRPHTVLVQQVTQTAVAQVLGMVTPQAALQAHLMMLLKAE